MNAALRFYLVGMPTLSFFALSFAEVANSRFERERSAGLATNLQVHHPVFAVRDFFILTRLGSPNIMNVHGDQNLMNTSLDYQGMRNLTRRENMAARRLPLIMLIFGNNPFHTAGDVVAFLFPTTVRTGFGLFVMSVTRGMRAQRDEQPFPFRELD